jgi:hypothetical protein
MKTIYKYTLQITDMQRITLPVGAEILCVQMQGSDPCLWAIVNDHESIPKMDITIRTYGTGQPLESTKENYIGTYQSMSGQLVFHVFK